MDVEINILGIANLQTEMRKPGIPGQLYRPVERYCFLHRHIQTIMLAVCNLAGDIIIYLCNAFPPDFCFRKKWKYGKLLDGFLAKQLSRSI